MKNENKSQQKVEQNLVSEKDILDKSAELSKRNHEDIEKLKDSQIKFGQDLEEKFKGLDIKNDRVKKIIEEMYVKYEKIQKDTLRSDLAETIKSATFAYEKFSDAEVKSAAKGLALATILKLHAEIDKI